MSKKVRVVLNTKGVGQLLKSEDLQNKLGEIAREKAGGWETDTVVLGTRAVASIYSEDREQIAKELESHDIVGGL
ncbi:MAG: hypothetical protein IJL43_00540 [Lachnospiraceae bacterium]|nr:hypothetical protein [Lachnospiraceae bacterium]